MHFSIQLHAILYTAPCNSLYGFIQFSKQIHVVIYTYIVLDGSLYTVLHAFIHRLYLYSSPDSSLCSALCSSIYRLLYSSVYSSLHSILQRSLFSSLSFSSQFSVQFSKQFSIQFYIQLHSAICTFPLTFSINMPSHTLILLHSENSMALGGCHVPWLNVWSLQRGTEQNKRSAKQSC